MIELLLNSKESGANSLFCSTTILKISSSFNHSPCGCNSNGLSFQVFSSLNKLYSSCASQSWLYRFFAALFLNNKHALCILHLYIPSIVKNSSSSVYSLRHFEHKYSFSPFS